MTNIVALIHNHKTSIVLQLLVYMYFVTGL